MTLNTCLKSVLALLFFSLLFVTESSAQRGRSNVLYSDRPMPIRIGFEIGTTFTNFFDAEPTFFPVKYPYSDNATFTGPDTVHLRFGPGTFTPLFGTYFGIAADFSVSDDWSILTKLNYNERRGNWNGTIQEPFDRGEGIEFAPRTSDLTLIIRNISLEVAGKYSFESLGGMYVGAGLAFTSLISNHYDIHEELGGPEEVSFFDYGTQMATGIREYNVGYEFEEELNSLLFELKGLVGYPIPIGYRWTLHPEVTVALPLNSIWTSDARTDIFRRNGVQSPPNPFTITGILGIRYEL